MLGRSDGLKGYVTTFTYRYLAIQILSVSLPEDNNANPIVHANPGPWDVCRLATTESALKVSSTAGRTGDVSFFGKGQTGFLPSTVMG